MHRIARRLVPALSLVALLAAPGCADREVPTATVPVAAPAFPSFSQSGALEPLATFRQRQSVTVAWAKKWIGPEGGRLDFMGFAVDVPAGAVDRVTMFSINLPVDPKAAERVVAEFGPHNQKFKVPVTIEFPLRGTSIEGSLTRTIVWWNGGWVNMGASVTPDGARLKTQTDHFSTYGTTDQAVSKGQGSLSTSGG